MAHTAASFKDKDEDTVVLTLSIAEAVALRTLLRRGVRGPALGARQALAEIEGALAADGVVVSDAFTIQGGVMVLPGTPEEVAA